MHCATKRPCSCATRSLCCSGAELIVPHDGEPGPTQRYSELYFKALETVGNRLRLVLIGLVDWLGWHALGWLIGGGCRALGKPCPTVCDPCGMQLRQQPHCKAVAWGPPHVLTLCLPLLPLPPLHSAGSPAAPAVPEAVPAAAAQQQRCWQGGRRSGCGWRCCWLWRGPSTRQRGRRAATAGPAGAGAAAGAAAQAPAVPHADQPGCRGRGAAL